MSYLLTFILQTFHKSVWSLPGDVCFENLLCKSFVLLYLFTLFSFSLFECFCFLKDKKAAVLKISIPDPGSGSQKTDRSNYDFRQIHQALPLFPCPTWCLFLHNENTEVAGSDDDLKLKDVH